MTKKKNLNILKPKELEGHKKKKKKKKKKHLISTTLSQHYR